MRCRRSEVVTLSPDRWFLGCLPAQPIRNATAARRVHLARLKAIASTGFAFHPKKISSGLECRGDPGTQIVGSSVDIVLRIDGSLVRPIEAQLGVLFQG